MCVMAWGSWLVPSQNVKFSNEQAKAFYQEIVQEMMRKGILSPPEGFEIQGKLEEFEETE